MAEIETIEMRAAYCNALLEIAEKDKKLVVLDADLMKASGVMPFKKAHPDRGIDVGVAEANLVGVASGLSLKGFIPFASTFACFAARRAFDQFFISSNYAKLNVKLVGTDPGVSAEFNGGTHMPFEDLAMMKMIPGLTIVEPSDDISAGKFTHLLYEHEGCCYMRLHRKKLERVYKEDEKFELGKAKVLTEGKDAVIFSLGGVMLRESLKAYEMLKKEGINVTVVDILTLKPLDRQLVIDQISKKHVVVTCENGQVAGGLASEIAEIIAYEGLSCKFRMVGVFDQFGQVGKLDYLLNAYQMTAEIIAQKIRTALRTTVKVGFGGGLGMRIGSK